MMTTEIENVLQSNDPSRRTLLRQLVAAGAGLGGLAHFSDVLAQASASAVKELTFHLQAGLQQTCVEVASPIFSKVAGAKVNYDIGANGITYPKMLLQRGNPSVNGGMFNSTYAARGRADKMWAKFNPAFIPRVSTVPTELQYKDGLTIPIHYTPFGIMYNPEKVEKPKSWTDLFNPKYVGKVSMWSAYFDAYIMAAVATGKGPDVEAGIKAWEPHKKNIGAWVTSQILEQDLVSRGEAWLAPHWGGWAEQARVAGKKVAFTVPEEGAVLWTGHMATVNGFSPEATELAQRYLDIWLSPQCQASWAEISFLSPSVTGVELPTKLRESTAVMSTAQLSKLVRPDFDAIGPKMVDYKAMIDRTLRV